TFNVIGPNGTWFSGRASAIGHLVRSFALYGAPALVGLIILARHGYVSQPRLPGESAQRVIVFAALVTVGLMLVLILLANLRYTTRYGYPFYGLCVLALLCAVKIAPAGQRLYAKVVLALLAVLGVGTLGYAQVFTNSPLREPAPAAAAALRA